MQLGLSSDAALGASVDDLVATCSRRGLAALELTLAPGISADQLLRPFDRAQGTAVHLSGLLSDDSADARKLAAISRITDAPIIVRRLADLQTGIRHTRDIVEHGGKALLLVRGRLETWLEQVTGAGVEFAWHVDDSCLDPAGDAEQIRRRVGRITYVRLAGGGPETAMQEGSGVGALMRQLALTGYNGPLILTPSSQRYRLAWSAWLGRRGGWGCGSNAEREHREIVPLRT